MKVWNYIIIMFTIAVLLDLAGLLTDKSILGAVGFEKNETLTAAGTIDGGIIFDFKLSTFFLNIFGTGTALGILIGLGAGLAIGFITKSPAENYVILGLITGLLGGWTGFFVSIIIEAIISSGSQTWIIGILAVILIPFTVGYVLALVEFFRGSD